MTYRPSSRPPQGRWALFLHEQRRSRDWSQSQAFEALRAVLGLGPRSRASYLALDMGDREPRAGEQAALVAFFGAEPSDHIEPVAEPTNIDLAAAITALVGELGEWRRERETIESRLRAVESELQSLRAPREGGASAALPVPPVEAGSGR